MAIVALACIILSWGPTLWITSAHAVSGPWLPWRTLAKLPVFRNILPVRFAIFTDLAVAVLIAVGIDTARTWPVWGRSTGPRASPGVAAGTAGRGEGSSSRRSAWSSPSCPASSPPSCSCPSG